MFRQQKVKLAFIILQLSTFVRYKEIWPPLTFLEVQYVNLPYALHSTCTLFSHCNIAVSIPSLIKLSYIGLQDRDTSFG